jgi:hypothetical protein
MSDEIEYDVAYGETLGGLIISVKKLIDFGFEPQGGIANNTTSITCRWAQAMIRKKK